MLRNHLKIAFRNLRRHRAFSFINIFGLAIGMACCLLIGLYVRYELSYDSFQHNLDQLYRIHEVMGDTGEEWASTPWAVAEVLRETYGDRVEIVRLRRRGPGVMGEVTIRRDDQLFIETNFFFADSTLFQVLTLPLVIGDPDQVLTRPADLVLTEKMAQKYFGSENPVGQTLLVNDVPYTVTGVLQNIPDNSHLQLGFLASMRSTWNPSPGDGSPWGFDIYYTYAKVADPAFILKLQAAITERRQETVGSAVPSEFPFVPVADIHLHSHAERELFANSDIKTVYLLSTIALLILLLACINFINLTTARSAQRAREVGVRKVLGANRAQVIRQFLSEALLLTAGAGLLALMLVQLTLPLFNHLIGQNIGLDLLTPWWMPLLLVGLVAGVGIMAGAYPAFYLSSFQPVRALKGHAPLNRRQFTLRHTLVVTQFSVSTALIICTLIISSQMQYMQRANLGLDKEQVLVLSVTNSYKLREHRSLVKEELRRLPGVRSVALSDVVPGERLSVRYFRPEGYAEADSLLGLRTFIADEGFVETFGLELVEGRMFEDIMGDDYPRYFVLNEAAVAALEWEAPIGKRINEDEVIGVVKDFNFASLHRAVEPMLIVNGGGNSAISLKLSTQDLPATIARIEQVWKQVIPHEPFVFYFLDDTFDQLYQAEATLRRAIGYLTSLAVLIACLGLFGLAVFTAEQRTKEIGVRKVLGATVPSLIVLLSKDFLKLVALALVLAAPIAYFAMHRWLDDFAYRVEISWWIFLTAGLAALLIALLTVSYQAIKAALADPVKSLRYE